MMYFLLLNAQHGHALQGQGVMSVIAFNISGLICLLANPYVILGLFILGFVSQHRLLFVRSLQLMLWMMVVGASLKALSVAVGLPALFHTKIFPSGHTLAVMAFYGPLLWWQPQPQRLFFVLLMIAYGGAICYRGYHQPVDVLGSWVIGFILLDTYHKVRMNTRSQKKYFQEDLWLWVTTLPFLFFLAWSGSVPAHAWMGFYALLGLTAATRLYPSYLDIRLSFMHRVITVLLLFSSFVGVGFLCHTLSGYLPLGLALFPWMAGGSTSIILCCVLSDLRKPSLS
ncbi:phosphatase PAP2 family protein [Candidatus Hepatobacter penaei]|uniref:phosphatase PAP2 family protein n=1 Tax=Candidatus Hepatobacter penaei TaxID=1274402 RepID=UPI0009E20F6F|nr:phosphatase PAP2 family protein [Candidatus Hepatobacter penaei]